MTGKSAAHAVTLLTAMGYPGWPPRGAPFVAKSATAVSHATEGAK